jgi:hypothetical protein
VPRFLTNTSAQRGLTGPVAVSGGGHHLDRGRVVCWTHQIDSYPGGEQHLTALCDGRSVAGLTLDSPVVRASSLSAVACSTQPRSSMGSSRTIHRRGRNESRVRDQVWRALWRVPANRTVLTVGRTLTCSPRSRGLMAH